MAQAEIIVFDTSSIIKLRDIPQDIFVKFWEDLHSLDSFVPEEVRKEIIPADRSMSSFFTSGKIQVVPLSKFQSDKVTQILARFRGLYEDRRYEGDPFVIALALEFKAKSENKDAKIIVVTEEKEAYQKDKIPTACKEYKVDCYNLFGFVKYKGWKY